MTPLWFEKHQHLVPSVFLSFFSLSSDPGTDSVRDNELKNEIMAISSSLNQSRYRTRLGVVLIGDDSTQDAFNSSDLGERMNDIRRVTRLDTNSCFLLHAETPFSDYSTFAASALASLRPESTEYYRDLTRHARRKRDKGVNSSFAGFAVRTPTSKGLPKLGWMLRYELKLGIFAEYRNEMDVAERHYSSALEILFDFSGPFQSISSWSPRWNEYRTLGDAIATRLIRCQLAINLPNSAVRSWRFHASKMHALLEEKGKGTENYGWKAWEARWAKIMSELVKHFRGLDGGGLTRASGNEHFDAPPRNIYAPLEESITPEKTLDPWDYLHHCGYWLMLSASRTKARRKLASEIPEDDRNPPGQSPASQVARRSEVYDTYMCLEPHEECKSLNTDQNIHILEVIDTMQRSSVAFSNFGQIRMQDHLRLDICHELMRLAKYSQAISILRTLCKTNRWRREGWWPLVQEMCYAIYVCASQVESLGLQTMALWELSSSTLDKNPGVNYDLHDLMGKAFPTGAEASPEQSQSIVVSDDDSLSPCIVDFCFQTLEGNASEYVTAQITLSSTAITTSAPIIISSIAVEFDGILHNIEIVHDANERQRAEPNPRNCQTRLEEVALKDLSKELKMSPGSAFVGSANMRIGPGDRIIMQFEFIPWEAGEIYPTQGTMTLREGIFELRHSSNLDRRKGHAAWWLPGRDGNAPLRSSVLSPHRGITIHPRPPKVRISWPDIREMYYTSESTALTLKLLNEEDHSTDVTLSIRALRESQSEFEDNASLQWIQGSVTGVSSASEDEHAIQTTVGTLASSTTLRKQVRVVLPETQGTILLEARISYRLPNNPDLPVTKVSSAEMTVIRPFEANYNIEPDLCPVAWPSYFDIYHDASNLDQHTGSPGNGTEGEADSLASGLTTRWNLSSELVSFASEPLTIEQVELALSELNLGMSWCFIDHHVGKPSGTSSSPSRPGNRAYPLTIPHHTPCPLSFIFDLTKRDMDDRRNATVHPVIVIRWRRETASGDIQSCRTILGMPPVTLATMEPRVLASRSTITLDRVPSTHESVSAKPTTEHSDDATEDEADATTRQSKAETKRRAERDTFEKDRGQEAIALDFMLENPSAHHLTFSLGMDSSEEFAFAGPKARDISLTPLSRREVKYVIYPFPRNEEESFENPRGAQREDVRKVEGDHDRWIRVGFHVVDAYFNKVLVVSPTGAGLKGDWDFESSRQVGGDRIGKGFWVRVK